MGRVVRLSLLTVALLLVSVQAAQAHVHVVASNGQQLANGQNHPGFVGTVGGEISACEGVNEPSNSGPAWYGLETAHHGPDLSPGAGDGCYTNIDASGGSGPLRPADTNPAIN